MDIVTKVGAVLLAGLSTLVDAQMILPPGTVDVPIAREGDCGGTGPATFVYRLSTVTPNDLFPKVCPEMGGATVHFNDPCKWAHGKAQMTMAHFTNMCKGATRVIHWHNQADEWGFVRYGRLQANVASPDGLPWPSSNNVLLDKGVWFFPAGWLHGLMCLTPPEEGGCEFYIVFASPQAAEPNGHNLGTTFAQASDEVSADALGVTLESYKASRPKFAQTEKSVHYTYYNMTAPIVTPVAPGGCEPECPPTKETLAAPAAMPAQSVEQQTFLPGASGINVYRIRTSSFPFSRTMSQERVELSPGATRPMAWATGDSILICVTGSIRFSVEGGMLGEEAHYPYTNETINEGDVGYIPNGRAFWFKEATGTKSAETIQVFNVGEWKSIEMYQAMMEMPQIVVDSNLNLKTSMLRKQTGTQVSAMLLNKDASDTAKLSALLGCLAIFTLVMVLGFFAVAKRRQSESLQRFSGPLMIR